MYYYSILYFIEVIEMAWDKVLLRILNAALRKLWPDDYQIKMMLLVSQGAKDAAMKFVVENVR